MIHLRIVNTHSRDDIATLYALLAERTIMQSISHKKMPTLKQHMNFVKSCPYKAWYIIEADTTYADITIAVGATYITKANELGISIFKKDQGHGYAYQALNEIMSRFEGPFLANINPDNMASKSLFSSLGFKMIQVTYAK